MAIIVKNSKERYCTRAVIGGANNSVPDKSRATSSREEFDVDNSGYFMWGARRMDDKKK